MSRNRMQPQDVEIPEYVQAITKRVADLEQLVRDYIDLCEIPPLWKYKDQDRPAEELQWRVQRRTLKDRARTLGHILPEQEVSSQENK